MARLSDEDMMLRFQQGNDRAFDFLFEKYRGAIFNFIFRMLNHERGAAEDLLQEIFTKVYRARGSYTPRSKFSTWLFSIARNHCLNFIKSRRFRQSRSTISLDTTGPEDGALLDRLVAEPEWCQRPGAGDISEVLERAISSLPDGYKEVFLLRALEGLSHDDIAGILGANPATVRTRYHRARSMLRDRLGDTATKWRKK